MDFRDFAWRTEDKMYRYKKKSINIKTFKYYRNMSYYKDIETPLLCNANYLFR